MQEFYLVTIIKENWYFGIYFSDNEELGWNDQTIHVENLDIWENNIFFWIPDFALKKIVIQIQRIDVEKLWKTRKFFLGERHSLRIFNIFVDDCRPQVTMRKVTESHLPKERNKEKKEKWVITRGYCQHSYSQ